MTPREVIELILESSLNINGEVVVRASALCARSVPLMTIGTDGRPITHINTIEDAILAAEGTVTIAEHRVGQQQQIVRALESTVRTARGGR